MVHTCIPVRHSLRSYRQKARLIIDIRKKARLRLGVNFRKYVCCVSLYTWQGLLLCFRLSVIYMNRHIITRYAALPKR